MSADKVGAWNSDVLGAGSWATAIAKVGQNGGQGEPLGSAELALAIQGRRENTAYLPGLRLQDNLSATSDLEQALAGSRGVYVVVPSHGLREVVQQALPYLPERGPIVTATKGIENLTLHWMTRVLHGGFSALTRASAPRWAHLAKEVAAAFETRWPRRA